MKKLLLLIPTIILLALVACNKKKTTEPEVIGLPVFTFASEDTAAVQSLANQFVDYFRAGNINAAADMLYIVRNDSVIALPEDQKANFKQALSTLPIYDCAIKEMNLYSNRDNEVRLALLIAEEGNIEREEGTINFFLNPVLQEGNWYLTLLSEYAEGVGLYH